MTKIPKDLNGFRTRRIHFLSLQSEQTAPNRKNPENTGKFTWLTTWLTAVTTFYYPINEVLKEDFKNIVIFDLSYLIPELSLINSQAFDLTP